MENEKSRDQSGENDYENQTKNSADKNPIAFARSIRTLDVPLEQIVIAFVRSEPEGENGAEHRHDADQFIGQNIQRHAREQDLG